MDRKVDKYMQTLADDLLKSEKRNNASQENSVTCVRGCKKWLEESMCSLSPGRLKRELCKYRPLYVKRFLRTVRKLRHNSVFPVGPITTPETRLGTTAVRPTAITSSPTLQGNVVTTPYNLLQKDGARRGLGRVLGDLQRHTNHEQERIFTNDELNLLSLLHNSNLDEEYIQLNRCWRDKYLVGSEPKDEDDMWEILGRESTFLFNSNHHSPLDRLMSQAAQTLAPNVDKILHSECSDRASKMVRHFHSFLMYFHFKHGNQHTQGTPEQEDPSYKRHLTSFLSLYFDLNALVARTSPADAKALGVRSLSLGCLLLDGKEELMSLLLYMVNPTQTDATFLLPILQHVIEHPPVPLTPSSYCKYILVCRLARRVLQRTYQKELVSLYWVSLKVVPPRNLASWLVDHWPGIAAEILVYNLPGLLTSFLLQIASYDLCQRLRSCITSLECPYLAQRGMPFSKKRREKVGSVDETAGTVDETAGAVNQTAGTVETAVAVDETAGTIDETAGTVNETAGADVGDVPSHLENTTLPIVIDCSEESSCCQESEIICLTTDDETERETKEIADIEESIVMSSSTLRIKEIVETEVPAGIREDVPETLDSRRTAEAGSYKSCRENKYGVLDLHEHEKGSSATRLSVNDTKETPTQFMDVQKTDENIRIVTTDEECSEGEDINDMVDNSPENHTPLPGSSVCVKSFEIVSDSEDERAQMNTCSSRVDRIRNLSHLGMGSPPSTVPACTRLLRNRCSNAALKRQSLDGCQLTLKEKIPSWNKVNKAVGAALLSSSRDAYSSTEEDSTTGGGSMPEEGDISNRISPGYTSSSLDKQVGHSDPTRYFHGKRGLKGSLQEESQGSPPLKRPISCTMKSPANKNQKPKRQYSESPGKNRDDCTKEPSPRRSERHSASAIGSSIVSLSPSSSDCTLPMNQKSDRSQFQSRRKLFRRLSSSENIGGTHSSVNRTSPERLQSTVNRNKIPDNKHHPIESMHSPKATSSNISLKGLEHVLTPLKSPLQTAVMDSKAKEVCQQTSTTCLRRSPRMSVPGHPCNPSAVAHLFYRSSEGRPRHKCNAEDSPMRLRSSSQNMAAVSQHAESSLNVTASKANQIDTFQTKSNHYSQKTNLRRSHRDANSIQKQDPNKQSSSPCGKSLQEGLRSQVNLRCSAKKHKSKRLDMLKQKSSEPSVCFTKSNRNQETGIKTRQVSVRLLRLKLADGKCIDSSLQKRT